MRQWAHCNSHTFQIFLDHLSSQHPEEFKIMLLDNGAFHHARRLKIPSNIALVFPPPYSPELNPAEKICRYFKDRVSMIAYNSLQTLQQKISEITECLTPQVIKSICGNEFYNKTFKNTFNF